MPCHPHSPSPKPHRRLHGIAKELSPDVGVNRITELRNPLTTVLFSDGQSRRPGSFLDLHAGG